MSENLLTAWRVALVAHLRLSFPKADVESGELDGVVRDRDRICVFWPGATESSEVHWAAPQLTLRFQKARPKTSLHKPLDDGPLEQAYWDLCDSLQPVQASLVPGVLFRLTGARPVRDEYGIECTLFAIVRNPATTPGG